MGYLIERFDHQGRGITKVDDKITFVKDALPGEIVDIQITHTNNKINEAIITNIEKKSDIRIEPVCKYYNECGGCNLMHIPYEEELKYKEDKIKQVIEKYTSLNTDIVKPIIKNDTNYYRNKITLHVSFNKLGYYNIKSNKIINIDKCYIVDEKINKIINDINKLDLTNVYEIVIRTSKHLNDTMVVFKITDDISNIDLDVDTILTYKDKKYNVLKGKGYIEDKIGKYTYKISPDSFFQVNTLQAQNLYNKVLEYLKPDNDNILDLYCGTGTIGIYVSEKAKHIKGIEINKYAVEDANENKKINNIDNIDFECLDASEIDKLKDHFDKIIIDPPRSGLDKKTINYILKSNAKKVVYVSCDPITLARDLEILKEKYSIKEITPVDMFSRTYHVECVCLLEGY